MYLAAFHAVGNLQNNVPAVRPAVREQLSVRVPERDDDSLKRRLVERAHQSQRAHLSLPRGVSVQSSRDKSKALYPERRAEWGLRGPQGFDQQRRALSVRHKADKAGRGQTGLAGETSGETAKREVHRVETPNGTV